MKAFSQASRFSNRFSNWVLRSGRTAGDPGDQPNVVLIMADDVSWEAIGCYGAEDYETPPNR